MGWRAGTQHLRGLILVPRQRWSMRGESDYLTIAVISLNSTLLTNYRQASINLPSYISIIVPKRLNFNTFCFSAFRRLLLHKSQYNSPRIKRQAQTRNPAKCRVL